MKVRFWGARGSIATPGPETARYGGNTSCVTVSDDATMIILDAGTGIRNLGIELSRVSGAQELHLLLTHTHWDHIQGFPFFVPAFMAGTVIHIYGLAPSEKPLSEVLGGQMQSEYFPVAMGELAAELVFHPLPTGPFAVGTFHVSWCHMNHPGITVGYRLASDRGVVTYATDTEPFRRVLEPLRPSSGVGASYGRIRDHEIVRLAEGADLYIADAQYSPEEYAGKRGWGHTSTHDAVLMAWAAGARRLALFHHDPMHDDAAIDRMVQEAHAMTAGAPSPLEVFAAAEGQEVTL